MKINKYLKIAVCGWLLGMIGLALHLFFDAKGFSYMLGIIGIVVGNYGVVKGITNHS